VRADAVVSVVRGVTGTPRGYLALAAVASIVALASALVMQYGFGLPPCDLCIEQRWGFAGAGALAAGGLLMHRIGLSRRAMVAAVGAAFLVTAGLGFRHVGVEQQWWAGPDTCTATGADAQTTDELLDAIMNALAAGATGYLQKYSGRDDLLTAVRDAAAGRSQIPVDMVRRALESVREAPARGDDAPADVLTAREREVLRLFAQGNSYAQVAGVIGNSPITVRNTIYRIEQKLGVTTKQEIVVWAVRHGLLDEDVEQD